MNTAAKRFTISDAMFVSAKEYTQQLQRQVIKFINASRVEVAIVDRLEVGEVAYISGMYRVERTA